MCSSELPSKFPVSSIMMASGRTPEMQGSFSWHLKAQGVNITLRFSRFGNWPFFPGRHGKVQQERSPELLRRKEGPSCLFGSCLPADTSWYLKWQGKSTDIGTDPSLGNLSPFPPLFCGLFKFSLLTCNWGKATHSDHLGPWNQGVRLNTGLSFRLHTDWSLTRHF